MNKVRLLAFAGVFAVSTTHAAIVSEKFATDPALDGWTVFGDTNLFQWDSTNHAMRVTWDSSQTNSYFYLPLGATYTKADSFCVQFDLNLTDENATNYFQIAAGLCNFADVISTNFSRANGVSPNLFEFDYFPDGPNSYGPSIDATLIDTNSMFYFAYDASKPMANGVTYHIVLIHSAGTSTITGTVYLDGKVFTTFPKVDPYGADDFRVDTLAIFNYTSLDDTYGDSLLVHGTISNMAFASPVPSARPDVIAADKVQFASDTNWLYTLEQSADLKSWVSASAATFGNGTNLVLQSTNSPADSVFYRVRIDLP